ncbi:hypothetical protein KAT63_01150 [Candidatus Parcubacteria bacterium]|nr:hypothetical protein [Candidatus Parcubacteria bacterium]
MTTKNTKEIRKNILEILYDLRHKFMVEVNELQENLVKRGFDLKEYELDQEIHYLDGKCFAEIKAEFMGKKFLNFHGVKITEDGIDLVEDPEEFGKMFTIKVNSFKDIQNSNINIQSPNVNQNIEISQNELTPEVKKLLEELKIAIEKKDKKQAFSVLSKLKDGAENVFWNIVSSGIYTWINTINK